MDDHRTPTPDVIGVEVGRTVVRGVRVDAEANEIVAVGEVPFAASGVDRDGIIEPSIVSTALDTLVHRLGVTDRSQARVGMTIGPRNAGVGSGPAMIGWLKAQAARLNQPFVCAGGLGVAFVPIRSVDQAVKTAFDIGLDLHRVDLAPVAAVRAIGEQVDHPVCVGSGRGWQARMRDFEVLEAMENQQVGPDDPVCVVAPGGACLINRYGWIDLSIDLLESGRVDAARLATAAGAAVGVIYESPANLLSGKVIGSTTSPSRPSRTDHPPAAEFRPEPTLQLNAVQVPERRPVPEAVPPAQTTQRLASSAERGAPAAAATVAAPAPVTAPAPPAATPGRVATAPARPGRSEWDDDRVAADDPINLFSPETDEAEMLGRSRVPSGFLALLILLAVVAAGLGAAYLYV